MRNERIQKVEDELDAICDMIMMHPMADIIVRVVRSSYCTVTVLVPVYSYSTSIAYKYCVLGRRAGRGERR